MNQLPPINAAGVTRLVVQKEKGRAVQLLTAAPIKHMQPLIDSLVEAGASELVDTILTMEENPIEVLQILLDKGGFDLQKAIIERRHEDVLEMTNSHYPHKAE